MCDYREKEAKGAMKTKNMILRPSNSPPRSPSKSKALYVYLDHTFKSGLITRSTPMNLYLAPGFSAVGKVFQELACG